MFFAHSNVRAYKNCRIALFLMTILAAGFAAPAMAKNTLSTSEPEQHSLDNRENIPDQL